MPRRPTPSKKPTAAKLRNWQARGGRGLGTGAAAMTEAQAQLVLRTNDFRHILPELVKCVKESEVTPRLIRIEGVMNVGKSPLADMLAAELDVMDVMHGDCFAYQEKASRAYAQAIDRDAFRVRLGNLLREPKWTIIEAVCLGDLAPEDQFGRGFMIYVKRVAVLGQDLHIWHGFDEDHEPDDDSPLSRSIHDYHAQFRPQEKADVLIVHPEEEHSFGDRPPKS
jgi:hypothetical protein